MMLLMKVMEMGNSSVVDRIYDYCLGVALGTGLGAPTQQKLSKLELDMTEEKVKLARELCEGKRIKSS